MWKDLDTTGLDTRNLICPCSGREFKILKMMNPPLGLVMIEVMCMKCLETEHIGYAFDEA